MRAKSLKPQPRCLFESIEGLDAQADMIRPVRIDEAGRLEAVDVFRQVAMEECVLAIQLVNWPSS